MNVPSFGNMIFSLRYLFMWTISKVFIEFTTILLLLYVLVFWLQNIRILYPQPGFEPTPPALEGKVLTTRLPWKILELKSFADVIS